MPLYALVTSLVPSAAASNAYTSPARPAASYAIALFVNTTRSWSASLISKLETKVLANFTSLAVLVVVNSVLAPPATYVSIPVVPVTSTCDD